MKKLYFLKILLFCIASLLLNCKEQKVSSQIVAKKGIIDLSTIIFKNDEKIKLDGEWEFYWNRFVSYEDIINKKEIPDTIIKVPGVWNNLKIQDKKITENGFATYHLLVKHSGENSSLALRIPIIETAYKLWVNEKLVYESGKIGKTKNEMLLHTLRKTEIIELNGDKEFHIIFQISNYMSRTAGIVGSILISTPESIYSMVYENLIIDMILAGSLLIMSFYHFGLYINRKKDRSPLLFGLFCFILFIRSLITEQRIFMVLFPNFPFDIYYRMDFQTAFLMFPLFATFAFYLFPGVIHRNYIKGIWFIMIFYIGATILLPHNLYTKIQFSYEILVLISIPFFIYFNIAAIKRKIDGSLSSLFGMILIGFASVIDILQTEHILYGHFIFPFSFFGFLFFQSYSLSIKFSKAFHTSENLTLELGKQKEELKEANTELTELQKGLEIKVQEKSAELEKIYRKNILDLNKVNSLEKELAIQKERQKIFLDIHDHMGSNLLDLKLILNKFDKNRSDVREDISKAKISVNKLEDNLRMKMHSMDDLEIFRKDPLNGIRLFIQRRYSIYNREIFFSCEESLFELSEDELSKNSSEAIFSIAQENATNDLKYGNGLSEWKFFRSGEFICLEILSNTNYNLEEAGKGRGEENIILRLNEIGGKMENLGNNQKFHVIYYFTQNT